MEIEKKKIIIEVYPSYPLTNESRILVEHNGKKYWYWVGDCDIVEGEDYSPYEREKEYSSTILTGLSKDMEKLKKDFPEFAHVIKPIGSRDTEDI